MLERLLTLQKRGRTLIKSGRAAASEISADNALKNEIDALYRHYYGRAITGCKNCYADALIELCSINKAIAMSKTDLFVVRRGKVLKDTIHNDARLNLVRGNETNELALYHLYTNPESRNFFEKLPDDDRLEEMINEYGEMFESERNVKNGTNSGSAAADKIVNDAIDSAKQIIENAHEEADNIVKAAKEEAIELEKTVKESNDNLIVEAKDEATKIIEAAKEEAAKIIEGAASKEAAKTPKKTATATGADPILK